MNPLLNQVIDEARAMWRFRWYSIALAFSVAIVGWTLVFTLPDRYEAYARVFVDTRTALRPALQGLTVDQDVDAQINYVRQSLLTGPLLETLAKDSGVLSATTVDEKTRDRILDGFYSRISLTMANAGSQGDDRKSAGTTYNFSYLDSDRARSLRVVNTLLTSFVERTLGGKREDAEAAQTFLQVQMKDYENRLGAAEDKLAKFKKEHVGLMPNDQGGFFVQLQNEVDQEKKAETTLAIAVSRRDELAKQLRGDAAISASGASSSPGGAPGAAGAGDTVTRIHEAQARLDELLLKFTDRHPDVIAARATLEELKNRRVAEMESLRKGDAGALAASGALNSPVYQAIQLELNKQDVEIAALRRELVQHQATVGELRKRLDSAPQVEAEYQQLNRDYESNKLEYASLLANYQKARLGEKADNAGSVRFEVIVPPTAPVTPVWPHRSKLLAEILLAALAAGAAVAYGLHMLFPTVTSSKDINEMTDFPLLGSVGMAFPTRARHEYRSQLLRFGAVASCLVVLFALAVLLNWSGVRLHVGSLLGVTPA